MNGCCPKQTSVLAKSRTALTRERIIPIVSRVAGWKTKGSTLGCCSQALFGPGLGPSSRIGHAEMELRGSRVGGSWLPSCQCIGPAHRRTPGDRFARPSCRCVPQPAQRSRLAMPCVVGRLGTQSTHLTFLVFAKPCFPLPSPPPSIALRRPSPRCPRCAVGTVREPRCRAVVRWCSMLH